MDIIYHRNCLDGVYSAYLLYLYAKSLTEQSYQLFLHKIRSSPQDICSHKQQQNSDKEKENENISVELKQINKINQQFFYEKPEILFHSISMLAGEFFPVSPSYKDNILIIVDTSPSLKKQLDHIVQRYSLILIIDHHSSFVNCQKIIKEQQYKNIFYFWKQDKCAAQLVLEFFSTFSVFPSNLPIETQNSLLETLDYVGRNDLKRKQSPISKKFVLGFYYFEIEMSHFNPWLYKRLWSLNLPLVLEKGSNQYRQHFQIIKEAVENCQLVKIEQGKYKGHHFLGFPQTDRGITSDLGSVLSFLSVKLGFKNLAMIYSKSSIDCRISFRSSQKVKQEPLALKVAQSFNGGGHVCAAGCQTSKMTFKTSLNFRGKLQPPQKLKIQELEKILFDQ